MYYENREDLKTYLVGLWSKSDPGSVIISTSLYSMRVSINYNKLVRYFESTMTTFTGINLDDKSYTLDDILSLDENIVVSTKPKRLKKVKETKDK